MVKEAKNKLCSLRSLLFYLSRRMYLNGGEKKFKKDSEKWKILFLGEERLFSVIKEKKIREE